MGNVNFKMIAVDYTFLYVNFKSSIRQSLSHFSNIEIVFYVNNDIKYSVDTEDD